MNFKKLKYKIKLSLFNFIRPPFQNTTYSQAGEDAIVRFLLNDKGVTDFTYLDIGTNIPNYGNNTFLFYKKRKKGVCVEADSSLIPQIKKIRPNDIVLKYGVSIDDRKEAKFYIFDNSAINTFDSAEAKKRQLSGNYKLIKEEMTPLANINDIIKSNFHDWPTILSLDIEGLDFDVLKSLNFDNYPIPIIIVETCEYSENYIRADTNDISTYMHSNNYFTYASTYINTIFVNKNWFYDSSK